MRVYWPLVVASVLLSCLIVSSSGAGVFQPVLPSSFESFLVAKSQSVFQNAGPAAGVVGGQVEGIGST